MITLVSGARCDCVSSVLEDKSCSLCEKRVTKTEIEGRTDHEFKSIRLWGLLCSYPAKEKRFQHFDMEN